jgi:hypothetical protein
MAKADMQLTTLQLRPQILHVNVVSPKEPQNLLHTVLKTKAYLTCIVGYTDLLLSSRPAARNSRNAMRLSSVTREVKTDKMGADLGSSGARQGSVSLFTADNKKAVGSLRFAA